MTLFVIDGSFCQKRNSQPNVNETELTILGKMDYVMKTYWITEIIFNGSLVFG